MSEPLLKVCGLTRPEDVALCHSVNVDFTGFILARHSPRYIAPEAVAAMPRGKALRVGVFVGSTVQTVQQVAAQAVLDLLQLHGDENPEFCRAVGPERVIKALWPRRHTRQELEAEMRRFAPVCAYFLLDAGAHGGGSGQSLDWEALRGLPSSRPWLLAGGIGPDTAGQALAACSPAGLDVNSAVETSPGVKDHALLRKTAAVVKR